MNYQSAINKINKYLDSDSHQPIIVDVPDYGVLTNIKNTYDVGSNMFVMASKYCGQDSLPQMDKMKDEVSRIKKRIFLCELSTYLKMEGEKDASQELFSLLDLSIDGRLVIITFNSSHLLDFADPRPRDAGRVIIIDKQNTISLPTLYFVSPNLSSSFELCIDGFKDLPKMVEEQEQQAIFISTKRGKTEFPDSLYNIRSYSSSFELLSETNHEIGSLNAESGTEEQWAYLRREIEQQGGWMEVVRKSFGGVDNLPLNLGNFRHYPDNKKWLYFIALKICGARNTSYLADVINKSSTITNFFDRLYTTILDYDRKSKQFKSIYAERREILRKIKLPIGTITDFCKQVQGKGEDAIFYLTDATRQEQELIIELLCKYPDFIYDKDNLLAITSIYPDLAAYLSAYDYKEQLLTEYFSAYKFNKVTNKIRPEFMNIVHEQAVKRDYNSILQPRAFVLSKMNLTETKLYFVDALGVEFLSYIQDRLFSKDLEYRVELARCELPSITSQNKDFVDTFKAAGCPVIDIKKLDDLKHEGSSKYNYENTKLPIHLIEEFAIIDEVIKNVEDDLYAKDVKRVFIVSDHGASRLAVINESENKWEVSEKGKHSGRCCPIPEIDEKLEFATEENGYWCLANYDRFKGGRKANVEVHGGASLEEVVIPIIEIKKAGDKPKCQIDESTKVIVASYKIDAKIRLFIARDLDKVRICLNGQYYDATHSSQKYYYDVVMPGVRKGKYSIDVYNDNTLIARGLTFEVKSAGASENKFF